MEGLRTISDHEAARTADCGYTEHHKPDFPRARTDPRGRSHIQSATSSVRSALLIKSDCNWNLVIEPLSTESMMQGQSSSFYQGDPTAGPSNVTLNSPQFASPQLYSADQDAYEPSSAVRSRGRGRGAGRGRGVGRGRGRGRGRGMRGGGARQSTRISTRAATGAGGGGGVGKVKLSLKMNASGAGQASGGRMMSFLGEYDRELDDNPEEPLEFEEQFILRVPREVADGRGNDVGLREMIKGKGKGLEGIDFKFLDSRRAAFRINGVTYSSKLVDLPCIVEAQRTHDSRHLFKIADISQMLVVDQQVAHESAITSSVINQDDYIWPHGLTPPLRHVRKRRFRKRLSRRMIEVVEEQVEELLKRDHEAENSTYDMIDVHPDADAPDSVYQDYDPTVGWPEYGMASEFGEGEMYDDPGSVVPSEIQDWGEGEEGEEDGEGEENYEDGEGIDAFDAELQAALYDMENTGEGESEEEEDGFDEGMDDGDEGAEDEDEEEDDEETAEKKAKIRQISSEIKQLEGAIEKKRATGFQGGNPIMMKRFEETIANMQSDITTKVAARQALQDELDRDKPPPGGTDGQVTAGATPVQDDVDMDQGAAAGETPGRAGSREYSEGVDDLFDEEYDDDGTGTNAGTPSQNINAADLAYSGTGFEDVEGEDQGSLGDSNLFDFADVEEEEGDAEGENVGDEFNDMLQAEIGLEDLDMETPGADGTGGLESGAGGTEDEFEQIVLPSSPVVDHFASDWSIVDGGAGRRRIIAGAEADSGSESSSDDSED